MTLSPQDWAEIARHFEALCDLPKSDQQARIRDLGLSTASEKQLRGMLAHDADPEMAFLTEQTDRLRSQFERSSALGKQVGAYRIEALIGEGAMGDVYTAVRADGAYDATVAIKFLAARASLRDQRLFDRERRILATLDHPGIARLIDAGEDERLGTYLVMEYVEGRPIDRYIVEENLQGRAILRLIIEASEAIFAAHRALILHRDLKPDHLIAGDDGRLRILDFGIAQFFQDSPEQAVRTKGISFTPRYAAPEQLLGEPTTTATDVYSLALITFELLAEGRSAFGDETTPSAQTMEKRLAGRLDLSDRHFARTQDMSRSDRRMLLAILRKALQPEPRQRYGSVGEFADDLSAVLSGKAVSARPLGPIQAMLRWTRYHRLSASLGMLALLATLSGTAFTLWFAREAVQERQLAVRETQRAEQTAAFLENLFVSASPGEVGPDVTARTLLGLGQERLQSELVGQPELLAHLEAVIGRSYLNLGLFEQALAITESDALPTSPDRALLGAGALNRLGRFAEALAWLDQAFPEAAETRALIDRALVRSAAYINLGDLDEADRQASEALRLANGDPATANQRITAQSMRAAVAFNRSDYDAALAAYEGILAVSVEMYGRWHQQTGMAHHNVGGMAFTHGQLDKAIDHYRQAVEIYREVFGDDNRAVGMSLRSLGLSLRRAGRAEDARIVLEETVAVLANWETPESPVYREAALQLVELYWLLRESDAARTVLATLPELAELQSESASQVECRLQSMARLVNGDLSSPACLGDYAISSSLQPFVSYADLSSPVCLIDHEMPQSVQAFVAYADLRLRWRAGERAPLGVDAVIASTEALTPPDPLLLEALSRLKSDSEKLP